MLAVDSLDLTAMALQPRYNVFRIPKKNGDFRLIEDPVDALQAVQATLNDYLQAVYWQQRSPAAYGFLVNPQGDDQPRHIETNAARHLGRPWLLNCDLLDFFHQITRERVARLFEGQPFHFKSEVAVLLADVCTFRGRCPMGAPTSPVLSNLVFAPADQDLLALAHRRGWTYSRYADDMSFSSREPMSWDDYSDIKTVVCNRHGYDFNEAKAKLYGPNDEKVITGLLLGLYEVEVPPGFIGGLTEDIRQLEAALIVQYRAGYGAHSRANERFRRSVEGKLRFLERIMGSAHPGLLTLEKAFNRALEPPTDLEQRSWLDFDYF